MAKQRPTFETKCLQQNTYKERCVGFKR
ncbi:unnamed protein product, partial [Allacma fusca]